MRNFKIQFISYNQPVLIGRFLLIFSRRIVDVTDFAFRKINNDDGNFIIYFNAEDNVAEKLLKQIEKQIDVFEAKLSINTSGLKDIYIPEPSQPEVKDNKPDEKEYLAVISTYNKPILLGRFMLIFSRRRTHVTNFVFLKINQEEGQFRISFNSNEWNAENIQKQLNKLIDTFAVDLKINNSIIRNSKFAV